MGTYAESSKSYTAPDVTGTTKESDPVILAKTQEQTLVNEGGEIRWTPDEGQFVINTTQTQAAAGTITGETISLDDVEIYTDNYFANITVSALGMDDTIAEADRLLITAAARARNTGAKLSKDGKKIEVVGEAPILVEQVEGTVTIKNTGDYEVYLLNSSGERVGTAAQHKDDQGYTVVEMQLADHAMHYELVKAKSNTEPEQPSPTPTPTPAPSTTPDKPSTGGSTSDNGSADNGNTSDEDAPVTSSTPQPTATPAPTPTVAGNTTGRGHGTTSGTHNSGKADSKTAEAETTEAASAETTEQPATEETAGSTEANTEMSMEATAAGEEQTEIRAAEAADDTAQAEAGSSATVVWIVVIVIVLALLAAGMIVYRRRKNEEE